MSDDEIIGLKSTSIKFKKNIKFICVNHILDNIIMILIFFFIYKELIFLKFFFLFFLF